MFVMFNLVYIKMKKLYFLLWFVLVFFVTSVNANFIETQNLSSLSCDEGNVSIYLDEDNDNDSYHDKDIYLNSNFEYSETTPPAFHAVHIRNDESKVQYTVSENNMLYSLKWWAVSSFDNSLYSRAALAFPYNTWVRGMDTYPNKVVFEQPINDIDNDIVVINYHYIYKLSNGRQSNNNYAYWYNQPSNYLDHSNNVAYCTLWSTTAPCSNSWSYRERSWFENTYTKNTCVDFDLFWCGDGELQDSSQNFNFGDSVEQCDPADQSQQWRWNQWCSNTCEPINQNIEAPTCTLNAIDMNNGSYNVNWNINGTFDSPTQITVDSSTVNQSTYNVNTNVWTWANLIPTGYGIYNVSMTVTNAWGTNTCSDTFYITIPEESICGDGQINLPNTNGVNEECDDGNINNGDGCNLDCELETPTCSLSVTPSSQTLWNAVSFNDTTNPWASYVSFDLDNGFALYGASINFVYNYVYPNVGFYDTVLTVENWISPIAPNVIRPHNICGVTVDILAHEADLDIDKILLSTGQLSVGDFVDYTITLTNNGNVAYSDAYITDVMPVSLDLISHNIVWVYPFTSADWQDGYGNRYFEYSGFDLMPGQIVVVNVRGQIRDGAISTETTNCAFTIGDVDCEVYSLAADPYVLKSQMMSNGSVSTSFTTWLLNVNFDDYITYRVDFANEGGSDTVWWVLVRDHMPLCVDYVSASIHGVFSSNFVQYQDINGRRVLEYDGFDLNEWQAWYMIVTGQIMDGWICDTVDVYTNDSYVYFYNPLVVGVSSVTANRSDQSVVNLTKTSDMDIHMPWDDKLFIVEVENFGPNPISNIVLEDIRPASTCIDYVGWTWVGFTKNPVSLVWTNTWTLLPGNSVVLYISGSIDNNPACVNPSYENVINLKYTELWTIHNDVANYHFAVSDTPVSNISLIKTADVSSATAWDTIIYTISYQNVWNVVLNSYVITDFWPAMVDFVSATPFPSSVVNLATWSILQWNFWTPLAPGQTWEIILEWIVN